MNRNTWMIFFSCFLISSFLFAQEKVTTVVLVRHAEKSAQPANDPVLSAQGTARAELLARMFEHAGVTAIYTSQYARTKMTAEPLAHKLGISIQTVDAAASKKLAETITGKHSGGTVLVVGHSNTLPEIIHALGGAKMSDIPDEEYNYLYVLTVNQRTGVKLLPMKFFPASGEQVCQ